MGSALRSGKIKRHVTVATGTAHRRNGQVASRRKHVGLGKTKFAGDFLRSRSAGLPAKRRPERRAVLTLSDIRMGKKSLVSLIILIFFLISKSVFLNIFEFQFQETLFNVSRLKKV